MSTAILPSTENLTLYMSKISKIPILDEKEEFQLAEDYYNNENIESAKKLILSHLKYVVYIAKSYKGYKLPLSDIIQEGNIGLITAVKKFNPYNGIRLITYATIRIKEKIHEFIIKNSKMANIATTKAQRKLFFGLKREKAKSKSRWLSKEERTEISNKLDVPEYEIETMEARLYSNDKYLSEPIGGDEDGEDVFFDIVDDSNAFENLEEYEVKSEKSKQLIKSMSVLNDREKDIVKSRWLTDDQMTLSDLADRYNVSPERIRQIEKRALELMKHEMLNSDLGQVL